MAIITCSNCKNEILDSEVVCPYCNCPVKTTFNTQTNSNPSDEASPDNDIKIASYKDFELEKEALMSKLAGDEKELNNTDSSPKPAEGSTVVISKDKIRTETKGDTDKIPVKDIKERVAKIRIMQPGEEKEASQNSRSRYSASSYSKKNKEKGKKLILAVTLIGVAFIIYLIYALIANIQNNMPSLKPRENKKAVVSSDAVEVDKGFKFLSSSTLVITSNDVMIDYDSAASTPWAEAANQIKHITIEDSVERIGDYAFAHFTSLEDVVFGKDVAEIGKEAFYGCESLERVTCRSDSKLRTIKNNAFTNCSSLESFKLGDSIKSIGDGAFKSCISLEELEIPVNVKIGNDVFLGCDSGFTIICSKDSSAHRYADTYGIKVKFTDIPEEEEITEEPEASDETSEENSEESETQTEKENNNDSEENSDNTQSDTENTENTGNTENTENSNTTNTNNSDTQTNNTGDTNTNAQTNTSAPDDTTSNNDSASSTNSENSGADNSNTQTNTNTQTPPRSQGEIVNELAEANRQLNDPNTPEDQKSQIQNQINSLSAELDNIGQ